MAASATATTIGAPPDSPAARAAGIRTLLRLDLGLAGRRQPCPSGVGLAVPVLRLVGRARAAPGPGRAAAPARARPRGRRGTGTRTAPRPPSARPPRPTTSTSTRSPAARRACARCPATVRGCSERVEQLERALDLELRVGRHGATWRGLRGAATGARSRASAGSPARRRAARIPVLVATAVAVLGLGLPAVPLSSIGAVSRRRPPRRSRPRRSGGRCGCAGHLGRGRLADPALLLRARRAELADEPPLARGRQVRLRPLALEHRAMAHVARDVVLRHRGLIVDLLPAQQPCVLEAQPGADSGLRRPPPPPGSAAEITFCARCAGTSS